MDGKKWEKTIILRERETYLNFYIKINLDVRQPKFPDIQWYIYRFF